MSIHCVLLVLSGYEGSDDGEDERTGIAEGGWREEKAESRTQLNRDMEKENGERDCYTCSYTSNLFSPA